MITKGVAALLSVFRAIRFILPCPNRRQDSLCNISAEDSEVQLGQLKRFCLQELLVATNYFSNRNIVGRGHYGKVYKGKLANGMQVAVKRIREVNSYSMKQFQEEVDTIVNVGLHQNLLQPIGFCMTPTERLLVCPYMVNGSVQSYLRERSPSLPPLDWPTRMRIAVGCAQGLLFLHVHCDPKIIHRDVRAHSILLNEKFDVVLGNFCVAILMNHQDDHVKIDVPGTRTITGYNAPENVSSGKFSEKSDVFGYGITLLELITGQRELACGWLPYDDYVLLLDKVKGFVKKKKLEDLVDPDLQNNYVKSEVKSLTQIALLCTQESPDRRPKMSEVVRMLQGNNGLSTRWEKFQSLEMLLSC